MRNDNFSITLWFVREYITGTKLPKENKVNHGIL